MRNGKYFDKCVVNDDSPDALGVDRIALCDETGRKLAIIGIEHEGEIIEE